MTPGSPDGQLRAILRPAHRNRLIQNPSARPHRLPEIPSHPIQGTRHRSRLLPGRSRIILPRNTRQWRNRHNQLFRFLQYSDPGSNPLRRLSRDSAEHHGHYQKESQQPPAIQILNSGFWILDSAFSPSLTHTATFRHKFRATSWRPDRIR